MKFVSSIAELEQQARQGDGCAFGQVLRHHDDDLRGMVWSVLRNGTDVDDVMQVSYEKALRSIGSFTGGSALKTWLHSICYHTAVDHLRYEGRRAHEQIDEDVGAARLTAGEQAQLRLEAAAALDALGPDRRSALYLTVVLGYSFDEAADIVGVSRGTLASRVARAKEQLRQGAGS